MDATVLTEEEILEAWRLSAFLHAQGEAGRDKVTWILPKPWAGAALWTKQDFEESLGKSEQSGIKIIIGERIKLPHYRPPKDARQDRVFVAIQVKGLELPDAAKSGPAAARRISRRHRRSAAARAAFALHAVGALCRVRHRLAA